MSQCFCITQMEPKRPRAVDEHDLFKLHLAEQPLLPEDPVEERQWLKMIRMGVWRLDSMAQ